MSGSREAVRARLGPFLSLVKQSRLLAPALKEMTLTVYAGNANAGNKVARLIIRDHLAALRWMNPNAVILLRDVKGQGTPSIDYSLCAERPRISHGAPRNSSVTSAPRPSPPSSYPSLRTGVGDGKTQSLEIKGSQEPEEIVASVLEASRDPDVPIVESAEETSSTESVSSKANSRPLNVGLADAVITAPPPSSTRVDSAPSEMR